MNFFFKQWTIWKIGSLVGFSNEEGKSKFKNYSTFFLEKYKTSSLRDHQKDALTKTSEYFSNEKNDIALLVLPTGTEKQE